MKTLLLILTLLSQTAPALVLNVAQEPLPRREISVASTEATLHTLLAKPEQRRVKLTKSIKLTKPLIIPNNIELDPQNFFFVQGGGATILFWGELTAGRHQVFYGFTKYEIKGTFGGARICPEHWGLKDGHHDEAINCAIRSSPIKEIGTGINVSMAPRHYSVAGEIDLTDSYSTLVGEGGLRTFIDGTPEWKPERWLHCLAWPQQADGNHAAMIYIGGSKPGASSFGTGIRGMSINCSWPASKHWGKYVSAISLKHGWAEEFTVIDHVQVEYASGFGIGFAQHSLNGNWNAATANGVRCTNLWFGGPMKRESCCIFTTHWANNCFFGTVTADMRLHKSLSREHAAEGGGDPAIYPAPTVPIRDYPRIIAHVQGGTRIEDLHAEGGVIAVFVPQSDGVNSPEVSGLKMIHMMDPARGAVYYNDGRSCTTSPPANTDFWGYSCGFLLSERSDAWHEPGKNLKDSFRGTVRSFGCSYLLRDHANSLHVSAFGQGQFPDTPTGGLTLYARGPAFEPGNFTLIR